MEISQSLEKIGLNKKESQAYLELLRLGTQPASSIARKMNIPRSTAHFLLENLVDRRFCIQTKKGNTFLFTAEPPQNIVKILETEKEKELLHKENQIDLLQKIMPEMEGMISKYTDIPQITFYEGIEGILKMFIKKSAKKTTDSYIFTASNYINQAFPDEVKAYTDEHNKKNEQRTDYVLDSAKYKKDNEKRNPPGTVFKYFPDKTFELKTHIQIDDDHIGIINIENTPIGVSIQHGAIAEDFRSLHQQLWKALG